MADIVNHMSIVVFKQGDPTPYTYAADGIFIPLVVAPFAAIQKGSVALVNGVSPFIPADITASSSIVASLKIFSGGGGGIINVKSTDRVNGLATAGGGFKITSIASGNGSTSGTDNGTYDWLVF